ncbi:hypothetical protein JWJ90_11130 [Desulfobulbus rhabdoformis]|jgi:hypothetical protein|nr:hypothetical protein [Desulfobulbus rhabdoformis]MBM9614837.1 hypothetical protein [Desulfobulbus rhabdoformis]
MVSGLYVLNKGSESLYNQLLKNPPASHINRANRRLKVNPTLIPDGDAVGLNEVIVFL